MFVHCHEFRSPDWPFRWSTRLLTDSVIGSGGPEGTLGRGDLLKTWQPDSSMQKMIEAVFRIIRDLFRAALSRRTLKQLILKFFDSPIRQIAFDNIKGTFSFGPNQSHRWFFFDDDRFFEQQSPLT